jgi:O-antigen ligase
MLLAETGAIGLAAFILMYIMVLRSIYRGIKLIEPALRPLQISLFAALIAVVWEMLWDMFDARQQGYVTWFLVSLAVILPKMFSVSSQSEAA